MKENKDTKTKKSKEETKEKTITKNSLLAVVRISGLVKVREEIENTLGRMRLRKKYTYVLMDASDKNMIGMLKKVRYYVAYGEIDEPTLILLIKNRARVNKNNKGHEKVKIDEEMAKELMKGKELKELGLKPFFRLHPPRKGIDSKSQYPKGVLGDNKKDINKLVGRMI